MGLQMSAESFNPRDESAIREQDVLMKHGQQAQNEEKHINKKYLQGSESETCAQLRSLRWCWEQQRPHAAAQRHSPCSCCCPASVLKKKKNIKQNFDLWPATHHRAQNNTQCFHILRLSCWCKSHLPTTIRYDNINHPFPAYNPCHQFVYWWHPRPWKSPWNHASLITTYQQAIMHYSLTSLQREHGEGTDMRW